MYAKKNLVSLTKSNDFNPITTRQPINEICGATVIQVNDTSYRGSVGSSRSSSCERIQSDLSAVTRVDLSSRLTQFEPHHGTPRSVKYRNKVDLAYNLDKQIGLFVNIG
ncbi:unnamed protein product [Dracunculus medinensis]|uniref:Uncharacterized protein n=1 Tax=Dracunculus medinensis TaxID=318479 RepID=A0A0N4UIE8_DRAME|nr:unnamed protein product [Dracunculus medinensis]